MEHISKMSDSDLDFALIKLSKTDITHALSIYEIFGGKEESHLTDFEKIICLEKLKKENLCDRQYPYSTDPKTGIRHDQENDPHYSISYDGWLLLKKSSNLPYTKYQRRERIKKIKRDIINAIPIITAIVAIFISILQLSIVMKSFNLGQQNYEHQNRAYMQIQNVRLSKYDIGSYISIDIVTKNGGLTPATAIALNISVSVEDMTSAKPNYKIPDQGIDSTYYLSGDTIAINVKSAVMLTNEYDNQLKAGKYRLFVSGVCTYKDVIEKRRRLYFYLMYDFKRKEFVSVSPYSTTGENQ